MKKRLEVKVQFFDDTFTALLQISESNIIFADKAKIARVLGLHRKKDFHLTIIGSSTGESIVEKFKGFNNEKIEHYKKLTKQLLQETTWEVQLTDKYYLIEKKYFEDIVKPHEIPERRLSIIQFVKIPTMSDFYKSFNHLFGTRFQVPFPHITLFTNSTRKEKRLRGIGVYSKKHFNELVIKQI